MDTDKKALFKSMLLLGLGGIFNPVLEDQMNLFVFQVLLRNPVEFWTHICPKTMFDSDNLVVKLRKSLENNSKEEKIKDAKPITITTTSIPSSWFCISRRSKTLRQIFQEFDDKQPLRQLEDTEGRSQLQSKRSMYITYISNLHKE